MDRERDGRWLENRDTVRHRGASRGCRTQRTLENKGCQKTEDVRNKGRQKQRTSETEDVRKQKALENGNDETAGVSGPCQSTHRLSRSESFLWKPEDLGRVRRLCGRTYLWSDWLWFILHENID